MSNVAQPSRKKKIATGVALTVLLASTACSSLNGLTARGNSDDTSTASAAPGLSDSSVTTPPNNVAVRTAAQGSASGTQSSTGQPPAAAAAALNASVAVRSGSIAETLDVIGKVASTEEVPLSVVDGGKVTSVAIKAGQTVTAGQTLLSLDDSQAQRDMTVARGKLEYDSATLAHAQDVEAAAQQAAAKQVANTQAALADQAAQAQGALDTATANLARLQAPPDAGAVRAAQNAVSAAQIQLRKAQSDQASMQSGADPDKVAAAEQELAAAQGQVAALQSQLDSTPGAAANSAAPASAAATSPTFNVGLTSITPQGVSTNGNSPANNYGFQAITFDPTRPGTIYVGTCYQGLWKTTDGGKTWAKINTGTNAQALDSGRLWLVALDPANAQTIYTAPGYGVGGLWKSTDGGVSWTNLFPDSSPVSKQLGVMPTPSNISFDPNDHLHIIASSHFAWKGKYTDGSAGVLESRDGGATWTIHDPVPNSGAEHQVAFLNDGSTWIESQLNNGTWRTTDGGTTWSKVADNASEAQNTLSVNGVLYLPAQTGMMRSTDNGATWQSVGPRSSAVASDGTNLYTQDAGVGPDAPLYYSPISDGINWHQLPQKTCTAGVCRGSGWMTYDMADHTLLSSNWLAGVWQMKPDYTTAQAAPVAPAAQADSKVSPTVALQQQLETAKKNVDVARAKLQAAKDGPDQNALDTAQLSVATAQDSLTAAQTRLNQLQSGPSADALRTARDGVTKAQAALGKIRAAQSDPSSGAVDVTPADPNGALQKAIDQDNDDIATLQQHLANTQLTAPSDGTIIGVQAKVGDNLDPGKLVFTLAKPGTPVVKVTITPMDADKVSVGQQAILQLAGQVDATPITTTVASLANNPAGTAKIATLQVDWGDNTPKLGTIFNVGLVLQQKDNVLLVPKKALHTAGTRSFVQVLDGKTRKVTTVEVGIKSDKDVEIVSGLSEGQLVVTGP